MRRAVVIAVFATPLVWLVMYAVARQLARDAGLDVPGPFDDLDPGEDLGGPDVYDEPWGDL